MNVDTLYSLAHLDLAAEPIVLVVPPIEGNRWWIMQVIDAWNDVPAAPGSRTHEGKGGNFALVGPKFKGTLPAGLEKISVDTSIVALGGRTYTGGKADYDAVHKIQDQYQLIPLSQWKGAGTKYTPPASVPVKPGVDAKTPVPAQVFELSAEQYFGRLCELLVNNPAREADAPVMARLAKLGIKPGAKFTTAAFDADTRKAIDEGVAAAQQAIRDEESKMGEMVNGWQIARDLGRYGTKYTYRATWTYFGVGGNLVEDAMYPLTLVDSDGNEARRCEQIRPAFCEGADSAGGRILVADDVRQGLLPRRQSDQPLCARRPQQHEARRRRLTDHLHSERVTRQGQGKQLAAGPQGRRVQAGPAAVHSEKASRRRHLETAGGAASEVNVNTTRSVPQGNFTVRHKRLDAELNRTSWRKPGLRPAPIVVR